MNLIKGKDFSEKMRENIAKEVQDSLACGNSPPGLVFIRVGEGADSASYLRSIERQASKAGFYFQKEELPSEISEQDLLAVIEKYNNDSQIDGIICSMPLPKHISERKISSSIRHDKDVEAQHPYNAGKLLLAYADLIPCTPEAVHQLLLHSGYELEGKHCVVLGRSNILGKPVGLLMLQENCTVTYCHSRTRKLPEIASQADILISCMGRAKMVDETYTNPEQIIIDVAINVDENGKLCGDVDFDRVADKVKAITPVPGGVGPVTNAILMQNTMITYKNHLSGNDQQD